MSFPLLTLRPNTVFPNNVTDDELQFVLRGASDVRPVEQPPVTPHDDEQFFVEWEVAETN